MNVAPDMRRKIESAKRWIEDHFRENPTQEQIAASLDSNPLYLSRMFNHVYGKTPKELVAELRYGEATKRMKAGVPPVEAWKGLGWSSAGAFYADYRKRFGNTAEIPARMPAVRTKVDVTPAMVGKVEAALRWIKANYAKCPSLKDVSNAVDAPSFYLHRKFKLVTGTTIKRHIDELRCAEAGRMLDNGKAPREVASRLSFCSVQHMNDVLKKRKNAPMAKR